MEVELNKSFNSTATCRGTLIVSSILHSVALIVPSSIASRAASILPDAINLTGRRDKC